MTGGVEDLDDLHPHSEVQRRQQAYLTEEDVAAKQVNRSTGLGTTMDN